jgi:8-amino-7-oxononanoate synthase
MRSLDQFAEEKLVGLDRLSLRRSLLETERGAFPYVTQGGRRLLSFSCNDYLGLSARPEVKAAAIAAIRTYGAGAGASRLVTGNHPLYTALESRLAAFKRTAAACVFGSGYLANIGVLGALAGPEDLVLIDELAHACLNAGANLSGAHVLRFAHNDTGQAAAMLRGHRGKHRHAVLVTETVFSMDGDLAPLAALAELCARHDAWLLTDDAHGLGVVPSPGVSGPLQMGTLSKALGGYGGYLCASAPVIDLIRTRARSLIYSTALPPASVAGAVAALEIVMSDPDLCSAPLGKARRFTARLGLAPAQSPIVPVVFGAPEAALVASAALADAGFLVTAIRPPTVPAGTARLRFAFSALHPDEEIDRLGNVMREMIAAGEEALCPGSS